jgi:hypothetical protein
VPALVGVVVVLLIVSVAGVWANRNVLDTDRFTSRVSDLAADPHVQAAVTARITADVMKLLDPQEFFESVLPDRGQALAIPLTAAVQDFVQDRVAKIVASDTFQKILVTAVHEAHAAAIRLLEGKSPAVQVDGDSVTLNLLPLIGRVLDRIGVDAPDLVHGDVSVPAISPGTPASRAIKAIEDRLGVKLPRDFGQIRVYNKGRLEAAQKALDLFSKLLVLSVILTFVVAALALYLSHRRRRTLLQLLVACSIGVVLMRRIVIRVGDDIAGQPPTAVGADAARAVVDEFVHPLLVGTAVLLIIFGVIAIVALVTGPYGWAIGLRDRVSSLFGAGGPTSGAVSTSPAATWVGAHRELLQVAVAAVGFVALLAFDLSWLAIVLLAALIVVIEIALSRMGPPSETPSGDTLSGDATPAG